MPHSPTPPDGRNPPDTICPSVVMRSTSRSSVVRNGPNVLVFEKTTNEPSEIGEVDERKHPDR